MQLARGISLLLGSALSCGATTYNCTLLDVPGTPTGINNAGVIVGSAPGPSVISGSSGYIRDASGNVSLVNYPGAQFTQLYTINNNGVTVGVADDGRPDEFFFTRDAAGTFTAIGSTPWADGIPMLPVWGINDSGQISGLSGSQYFILNPDGTTNPLPSLNQSGQEGGPGSLNNSQSMLETALPTSFGTIALAAPEVQPVPIAPNDPTGTIAFAYALNNAGAIAGFTTPISPGSGPPVWNGFTRDTSGIYSSLICTGLRNIQPYAINDNGIVTGVYTQVITPAYFMATPVSGSAQFNSSVTNLNFGVVPLQQASAPLPVVISNSGNVRMDFGVTRFRGNFPPFSALGFTATSCMSQGAAVTSLAPGESCVINVTAGPNGPSPPVPGSDVADTLVIYHSALNSPYLIPISAMIASGSQGPPPGCSPVLLNPGPPRQVLFTFTASVSPLQSIAVLSATNVSAPIPSFTPGTDTFVQGTVVQLNPQQYASVQFQVTNTAGVSGTCSVQIYGGANQWTSQGVSFRGKITIVPDSAGVLQAFVRADNGNLLQSSETAPGGPWSAWQNLGGVLIGNPQVSLNAFNGFDVFAVGTDRATWHISQTGPGSAWTSWASIGGSVVGEPAVALIGGTILEVFARGDDSAIWYTRQPEPGGTWSGWSSLGGYLVSDPVTIASNGGALNSVSVYALGGDRALWNIVLTTGLPTPPWASLGGGPFIGTPVIEPRTETVFIRDTEKRLWYANLGQSGWNLLDGYLTSDPAVTIDANESIEVFGRGGDNSLWYASISSFAGGPSTGWTSLGGVLSYDVAAAIDSQQRIEVYGRAPDGSLWGIAQVYPGYWQ